MEKDLGKEASQWDQKTSGTLGDRDGKEGMEDDGEGPQG